MYAKAHSNIATSKANLMEDLQMVVTDAEELLHATANQAGESAAAARARIQTSLQVMKERMTDAQAALVERGKITAKATDEYARENPWKSIGVTAALGLIAGMLIARR